MARIYSALVAAGINYVPGSLHFEGQLQASADDSVLIGVPIGVSFGVIFLASIVAFRCFQERKGAHLPARRSLCVRVAHGRRLSRRRPCSALVVLTYCKALPPAIHRSFSDRAVASGKPVENDSACCSVSYSNVKSPIASNKMSECASPVDNPLFAEQ